MESDVLVIIIEIELAVLTLVWRRFQEIGMAFRKMACLYRSIIGMPLSLIESADKSRNYIAYFFFVWQ